MPPPWQGSRLRRTDTSWPGERSARTRHPQLERSRGGLVLGVVVHEELEAGVGRSGPRHLSQRLSAPLGGGDVFAVGYGEDLALYDRVGVGPRDRQLPLARGLRRPEEALGRGLAPGEVAVEDVDGGTANVSATTTARRDGHS